MRLTRVQHTTLLADIARGVQDVQTTMTRVSDPDRVPDFATSVPRTETGIFTPLLAAQKQFAGLPSRLNSPQSRDAQDALERVNGSLKSALGKLDGHVPQSELAASDHLRTTVGIDLRDAASSAAAGVRELGKAPGRVSGVIEAASRAVATPAQWVRERPRNVGLGLATVALMSSAAVGTNHLVDEREARQAERQRQQSASVTETVTPRAAPLSASDPRGEVVVQQVVAGWDAPPMKVTSMVPKTFESKSAAIDFAQSSKADDLDGALYITQLNGSWRALVLDDSGDWWVNHNKVSAGDTVTRAIDADGLPRVADDVLVTPVGDVYLPLDE